MTVNIEGKFHQYIKPDVNPVLSEFCTELTGMTQSMVDSGISLKEALALHQKWLDEMGIVPAFLVGSDEDKDSRSGISGEPSNTQASFIYVRTCGDWDLKTCLPNQRLLG